MPYEKEEDERSENQNRLWRGGGMKCNLGATPISLPNFITHWFYFFTAFVFTHWELVFTRWGIAPPHRQGGPD